MRTRQVVAGMVAAVLAATVAAGAEAKGRFRKIAPEPAPAIVTGIHWGKGRLQIEADRPLQARLLTLPAPNRVVIDLFRAEFADPSLAQTLPIQEGPYRQLRVALHPEEGFVRFVLDCDERSEVRLGQLSVGSTLVLFPDAGSPRVKAPADDPLEYGPPLPPDWHVYGPPLPPNWYVYGPPEPEAIAARLAFGPPLPDPHEVLSIDARQPIAGVDLKRRRGALVLCLRGERSLAYDVAHEWAPPRVSIRVPKGRFQGTLPAVIKGVDQLKVEQDGPDWILRLALPRSLYRYDARRMDNGRTLEVSWSKQALRSDRPTVILDAGHGGGDPGAIGPGGTREAIVTLGLAKAVQEALQASRQVNVVMTRTTDAAVDLASRARMIEALRPALFVSLHGNSCSSSEIGGLETYYRNEASLPLARHLHHELARTLQRPDRGIRQARLYVLRNQDVPSVLIESAYMSNPNEERLLMSEEFRHDLGDALAKGILGYLQRTPIAGLE